MTKEELKKEAEEKADIYFNSLEVDNGNVSDTRFSDYDVFVAYEKGALDFAEPREKQIELLGERCNQLLKEKGELTDKLKTIIKKMRCCGNCSHRHYWGNELDCNLDFDKQFECDNNNKKYWEFKEE